MTPSPASTQNAPPALPIPAGRALSRLVSIDVLRGAVMVVMALDHIRDFVTDQRVQPEALARHGSAALFATRWVTHFCAPTFALLAGLGIGIMMDRGKSPASTSRYLLTRGLWLIVLDLGLTPVAWRFSFNLLPAFGLVLWSLGLSMIVMAAVIHLPRRIVAAVALLMIATHNLADGVTPESWGALAPLWHVLHVPGFAIPNVLLIGYPLIPWVGVMALGWTLAECYRWDEARRRKFLITIGAVATILFVAIRAVNGYGDQRPWTPMNSTALSVASFLNVAKYPPSLDFLLMTLGPALIALALLEHARGRVASWLATIGSVPLFFYVVHIVVVHTVGVVLAFIQGGTIQRITAVTDPSLIPKWYGVGLPGVYLAWAIVVLVTYPLCRWYSRLRRERPRPWMTYL